MKAKKLISILLSLVMVLGALPLVALNVTAASTADPAYTYYYYEDFENLSTDMTSEAIAEALGWDEWDHSVATLTIVETIYMREYTTKNSIDFTTVTDAQCDTLGIKADRGKGNIKTVDVADVEAAFNITDEDAKTALRSYTSYSKKLLITPVTANANTEVILTDNVNLGANEVFVDYELTPRFAETLDNNTNANTAKSYDSDSSVGITLANQSGKSVTQALMVNASLRYSYNDGETTTNSDITSANWYTSKVGLNELYQDQIDLDLSSAKFRTYKNGKNGSIFLGTTNSLNGYRFTYRMKFTNDEFHSFVGNTVKVTDLDASYMGSNDAASKGIDWKSLSDFRTTDFDTGAKTLMDGSTGTASLSVNHAGVAYYLDNIMVANFNGKTGDSLPAIVKVTVNGVVKSYRKDTSVYMQSFTPDKALVYATVGDDTKFANDFQKVTDGLVITTKNLDIDTRYGAAARLNTFTGLRWTTDVNKEDLDALVADGNVTDIVIGTVIAPTSSLATKAWGELSAEGEIPECLHLTTTAEELVKSEVTDGNYSYAGSLVGIKTANYERAFSGVGYISMKVGETTVTLFGNYSEDAHSRDIKTVAVKALADVCTAAEKTELDESVAAKYVNEIEVGETYYDENGEAQTATDKLYSRYTADERDILKDFFAK